MKPEEAARQTIDAMLADAGWLVQDVRALNLYAGRGVAVGSYSSAGTARPTTGCTSTAAPSG